MLPTTPVGAMSPVPADSPLMIAWEAYKATPEYANSRKWALLATTGGQNERDVDGSLWAAFCAGRESVASETKANIHDEIAKLNALFPLLWHINDHLSVTPDQHVEYSGSTNDVDSLRAALHRLDPEFARGTMP